MLTPKSSRIVPAPEPLARRAKETAKQWRERLTAKQQDELKAWQAKHRWSPNQLRHTAGTDVRKRYGLEAAQVVLGHASAGRAVVSGLSVVSRR
ncbi:MAG: hypothetical protein IH991_15770 [Planctomycetes bacterium]|nr:hypothetical protein [Planctomycetota bacterium]